MAWAAVMIELLAAVAVADVAVTLVSDATAMITRGAVSSFPNLETLLSCRNPVVVSAAPTIVLHWRL